MLQATRVASASNQFSKLARGAVVHAVDFAWQLAGSKQTINPSQVIPDLALACDCRLDPAACLPSGYVIDEPVGPKVDSVLPQPALYLVAVYAERRSSDCNLEGFVGRGVLD